MILYVLIYVPVCFPSSICVFGVIFSFSKYNEETCNIHKSNTIRIVL